VSEKRELRRMFGSKREEVTGGWRRLHNEELHYLYISEDIIGVIKTRWVKWAGHTARIGEMRNVYKNYVRKNLKGRDHSEDLGIDGRIILEWILGK
jgi:hypothetical protein